MAVSIDNGKGRKAPHMTTATRRRRGSFGRILRSELEEKNVTVRELSRRIAAVEGSKPDNVRRLLHQYLAGEVSPRPAMRLRIANALAIDPGIFAEDTERQAEHERLMDALEPLADILLDLAVKARG